MPATCLRNFTVLDLKALDYKLCCFALWNVVEFSCMPGWLLHKWTLPDFRKLRFATLKKRVLCDIILLGCSISGRFTTSDIVSECDWKRRWNPKANARRQIAPSPVVDPYNTAFSNYITCRLIRNSLFFVEITLGVRKTARKMYGITFIVTTIWTQPISVLHWSMTYRGTSNVCVFGALS